MDTELRMKSSERENSEKKLQDYDQIPQSRYMFVKI